MSKFIDRLKQVSQPPPPPMGFGAAKSAAERPKIQLIASLGSNAANLGDSLAVVDAVVFSSVKKNSFEKTWGVWLKKGDATEVEQAGKSQADFVILPADSTVLSLDVKIGTVLQLENDITDIMLRAANELQVDAFLIDHVKNEALTWQKLMALYRFGGLLNKPVLVVVGESVTRTEIQQIWETGISGLVVKVADEAGLTALNVIREAIDSLPFPSKKKKDKMSPVLPQVSASTREREEEPDEDNDGDDE
ncbi:MAG: hypothetical protein PHE50_05065 [Dehalococcoidales bacterium]|nr:hypothetical protein [Dehalococcoidales bacterium]